MEGPPTKKNKESARVRRRAKRAKEATGKILFIGSSCYDPSMEPICYITNRTPAFTHEMIAGLNLSGPSQRAELSIPGCNDDGDFDEAVWHPIKAKALPSLDVEHITCVGFIDE